MSTDFSKTTSSSSRRGLRMAALVGALLLIPVAPAKSADEAAVAPTIDREVQFELGSTVEPHDWCGEGFPIYYAVPGQLKVEVSGLRPMGVDGTYQAGTWMVESNFESIAEGEAWRPNVVTGMTLSEQLDNYNGDCGGGSVTLNEWYLTAVNPGNPPAETRLAVLAGVLAVDEDGSDLAGDHPDANIVTKGQWGTSFCKCWMGGAVLRTSQRAARMKYTFEVTEGAVVAVVMPKAPNRGEARIKLDGVNQGKVDTYSATKQNRIVMWQTPPLEAGTHTIKIINLATEGRSRIDVDAFLVTGGRLGG